MFTAEEKVKPLFRISFYQRFSPFANEIIMKFNRCRHGNPPVANETK